MVSLEDKCPGICLVSASNARCKNTFTNLTFHPRFRTCFFSFLINPKRFTLSQKMEQMLHPLVHICLLNGVWTTFFLQEIPYCVEQAQTWLAHVWMFGTSVLKIVKDVGLWTKASVCCRDVGTLQRTGGVGIALPRAALSQPCSEGSTQSYKMTFQRVICL